MFEVENLQKVLHLFFPLYLWNKPPFPHPACMQLAFIMNLALICSYIMHSATKASQSLVLVHDASPFLIHGHNARQSALQRTKTENWKEIFPEKEQRGHSPNLHIHVSAIYLYIPMIDLPILLQEICGPILGIYKSLTDT
jgi:hypothetical protein